MRELGVAEPTDADVGAIVRREALRTGHDAAGIALLANNADDLRLGVAHCAAASAVAFRRRAAATTLETRELPGRLTSCLLRVVGASRVVGRLSITESTAAKSTSVMPPNRLATSGYCRIIAYIFGRLRPYLAQASSIEPLRASTVTEPVSFENDMMGLSWVGTAQRRLAERGAAMTSGEFLAK